MRRLYSTFAGGWPGAGLLLMRLVAGSALLASAGSRLWTATSLSATATAASLATSGLLLVAGLWTPLAGVAVAFLEFSRIVAGAPDPLVGVFGATIGAALAMLGPGRWSVDAWLFGWKRIEPPIRTARLSER